MQLRLLPKKFQFPTALLFIRKILNGKLKSGCFWAVYADVTLNRKKTTDVSTLSGRIQFENFCKIV